MVKLLYALIVLFFVAFPGRALNPATRLSQFAHTAWKIDGFGEGNNPIAQTADGFIWFGTLFGMLRFDGVSFVPQSEINSNLPSRTVSALLAAKDGSLWIGTERGLSHWVNGKLINFPGAKGFVLGILESRNGEIWFTNADILHDQSGAFCQVIDLGTKCYGKADGVLMHNTNSLVEDAEGYLWSSDLSWVVRWKPGTFKRYKPKAANSQELISGVYALALKAAGDFWIGIQESGPGLGLQQFDAVKNRWSSFRISGFDSSTLPVRTLLVDRQGALWVGTEGMGLYRIKGNSLDRFQSIDGLSSDSVRGLYEDREGNLWTTSAEGVDCFHQPLVTTFPIPEGPGLKEADGIHASRDGTLWVSRPGSLGGIRNDRPFSLRSGKDLPGKQVTSIFEDHAGRLWVGIDRSLFMYQDGVFHPIRKTNRGSLGLIVGLTEDVEGDIWAEATGWPRTLLRIRNLQVQEEFPTPQMPAARKIAADPEGGIWLGLMDGGLARFRGGKLESFSYPRGQQNSYVEQITVNGDGSVFGSTENGLIAWKKGTVQTLTTRNGLPCDQIFAHIFDARNSLWLYTSCGLVEIGAADLARWWQNPDAKLLPRTLDRLDGAHAARSYFDGAARTSDGRLWFANAVGVQMLDPSQIATNLVPPSVVIKGLIADRNTFSVAKQRLRLPSLIRDLEIDYTALSFVVPEKVRFRFRLDGHDTDWKDPGTRREAFYNDLEPGDYTFRVIASNNDGLWNETGAALDFNVAAAWYQSIWFRFVSAAALLMLIWLLYQVRVHQIAIEFQTKVEASVAERTRIARELHDTLLQSLHGLMFRFQAGRNLLPQRPAEAMQVLDGAIASTEQAIVEGRDAIKNIRGPAQNQRDVAAMITAVANEVFDPQQSSEAKPAFSLTVEGKPRLLSALVQDEVYRIAHELLTNSMRHAEAHRIEVEVRYDRRFLRLRFRDDGKGIGPDILKTGGRVGHWGLPGIRERANRIGAQLQFWSESGAGTEVQLKIPSIVAYERLRQSDGLAFVRSWRKYER